MTLALSQHSQTICTSGMVAVFRNMYQSSKTCIWSNPGLYGEGMAYWREIKTKIPSFCFWYLGCWSKGQMFSKKPEDPFIWTQHYLSANTNRLIVFQFSISTLHILNYFLLPEQRSSMKRHTPVWCFSPTLAHGLQLRQQQLSCLQHSSQASLRAWAQHSSIFLSYKALQNPCTVTKPVLVRNKDSEVPSRCLAVFRSLDSRMAIASLFAVQLCTGSKGHITIPQ